MTQLDVLFRYGIPPSESSIAAIARIREVYGVRQLAVDERAHTVRIEYDATRLSPPAIHRMLRGAGLDITETVSLTPPPPAPSPTAPTT